MLHRMSTKNYFFEWYDADKKLFAFRDKKVMTDPHEEDL